MNLISAKEIQAEYDISFSTINYYTNLGLLPIAGRRGNMRLYDPNQIKERMEKIRRLRHEGFSLRLIQRRFLSSSGGAFLSGGEF